MTTTDLVLLASWLTALCVFTLGGAYCLFHSAAPHGRCLTCDDPVSAPGRTECDRCIAHRAADRQDSQDQFMRGL